MKQYWHELSQADIDKLIGKVTNQFIMDNYKQPDWCTYPEALSGLMGCWSLGDATKDGSRTKISNKFCEKCDYYKLK